VAASNYIARYDAEPEFWQFLNGLTHEDLISELVQNELDAESGRTCIRFEADRLICEGNGQSIDAEGWTRLSFIRGAGKDAPRKRFRIGVKNHGLKTCFTVGDEIVIRSDGKLFEQTLYRNGSENDPAPATFEEPVIDPGAPMRGCRIEVPYRTRPLVTKHGEPFEFAAPEAETIEEIFRRACTDIPQRFIGVIRPGVRESYEIELRHHRLGSVTFLFRCTAARRVRGRQIFSRSCVILGDSAAASASVRETACVFAAPLPPSSTHEIPLFYKDRSGFLAEVAWRADSHGIPSAVSGDLRYPIAYAGTGAEAHSGLGVHYSGPFISDPERHGISAASFNPHIITACDAALIAVLRDHLIPKYGARALRLLVDPVRGDAARLRGLTTALLAAGAVPLARRQRGRLQFGPRIEQGVIKPVVVPVYLWDRGKIAQTLVHLCPPDLDRIDSRTPTEIVELLADEDFPGWQTTHVSFDEHDALKRMQPTQDAYYPWPEEAAWRKELGNPRVANTYLDVLFAICEKTPPSNEEVIALRDAVHLPDTRGTARPISELFIGNELPATLGALGVPPLLHASLVEHRLFKRRNWKLRVYSFGAFLDTVDVSQHSEATRRELWTWLRRNWKRVPKKSAGRLAALPVWPARGGETRTLKELCLPRNPKIAQILSTVLCLPALEVEGFRALRRKGRGTLVLRGAPSPAELHAYYYAKLNSFPRDRQLAIEEVNSFRKFENELTTLASDRQIATWVARQTALRLSRDRHVKPVAELHRETPQIASLALLDGDLLDSSSRSLDKIFPARAEASTAAIARALEHDAVRGGALIPRLKALAVALRRDDREDKPVALIACIPHEGGFLPPDHLGFKSNRGDYWGDWKISLSGKGLSADEQALYRQAGVTSGEPDGETSHAFFQWLNEQSTPVVAAHLEAIIRHFAHLRGVRQWWESYPDLPCLPVRVGQELRLVSRRRAVRKNSPIYLPDFDDLAQTIRDQPGNERVALAVDSLPNVTEPITQFLRDSGLRSLRHTATTPFSVLGDEPRAAAGLFETVKHLRSGKMENLRKRLAALDFTTSLRVQWRSRLEQIRTIMTAARVHASFLLGGRIYRVASNSGFDEKSGVIWLKRTAEREIEDALFEALTQRVFDENAPKYAACVLQKAVRQEFREVEPFLPDVSEDHSSAEPNADDPEPGESSQTHRPAEADPSKNLPHPGPIPQSPLAAQQQGLRVATSRARPTGTPKRNPVELEDLHRVNLKQNQYAWHCQVCLAARSPRELAPEGSYVALAENRQKLIEAHHADQVHADGARHAGNLIVLCHHHHHQLGNALSRDQLTRALASGTKKKTVTFFSGDAAQSKQTVEGQIVSVRLASTGRPVKFFFTTAHRDHWLRASAPNSTIVKN
jgi:hypothetical protein